MTILAAVVLGAHAVIDAIPLYSAAVSNEGTVTELVDIGAFSSDDLAGPSATPEVEKPSAEAPAKDAEKAIVAPDSAELKKLLTKAETLRAKAREHLKKEGKTIPSDLEEGNLDKVVKKAKAIAKAKLAGAPDGTPEAETPDGASEAPSKADALIAKAKEAEDDATGELQKNKIKDKEVTHVHGSVIFLRSPQITQSICSLAHVACFHLTLICAFLPQAKVENKAEENKEKKAERDTKSELVKDKKELKKEEEKTEEAAAQARTNEASEKTKAADKAKADKVVIDEEKKAAVEQEEKAADAKLHQTAPNAATASDAAGANAADDNAADDTNSVPETKAAKNAKKEAEIAQKKADKATMIAKNKAETAKIKAEAAANAIKRKAKHAAGNAKRKAEKIAFDAEEKADKKKEEAEEKSEEAAAQAKQAAFVAEEKADAKKNEAAQEARDAEEKAEEIKTQAEEKAKDAEETADRAANKAAEAKSQASKVAHDAEAKAEATAGRAKRQAEAVAHDAEEKAARLAHTAEVKAQAIKRNGPHPTNVPISQADISSSELMKICAFQNTLETVYRCGKSLELGEVDATYTKKQIDATRKELSTFVHELGLPEKMMTEKLCDVHGKIAATYSCDAVSFS